MIQQAVVLATSEALERVGGVPLVKRTIMTLSRAGVTRFQVVVAAADQRVRALIERDATYTRAGLTIELVEVAEPVQADSAALHALRGRVAGPFLVASCNYVFDPALAKAVAAESLSSADVALCGGAERAAGLGGGVLAATPALFDALDGGSIADGVRRLAAAGRVRSVDDGGALWMDASTPAARAAAQRALLKAMRKASDGPVSRYLNRPMSLSVTRLVLNTGITPNQMTVVANAIGFVGVWLVFRATWTSVAVGATLVHVQSVLDGCDGELARLKFQSSRFGEWFDNVLDNLVNSAFGLALGVASASLLDMPFLAWIGIGGALGFVFYDLVVYAQLIASGRGGNPMNFRWWFQKQEEHIISTLGKGNPLTAAVHSLTRRDVFLFVFMLLAIVRLPQVAAVWYSLMGAGHLVLSILHVSLGGAGAHVKTSG